MRSARADGAGPLVSTRVWALDHALGSTSKRMHDRMGITAKQRMVLRFVGKYPGITGVELASILHIEKGPLSLALKRLENRGLGLRRRAIADARKTLIVLTNEGRKFDRPAVGTVERAVARALRSTPARDRKTIRAFLQRLVRLLAGGVTTGRATRGASRSAVKTRALLK